MSFYICPNSGYTLLRLKAQVNYGLWMTSYMSVYFRFINCNQGMLLMWGKS